MHSAAMKGHAKFKISAGLAAFATLETAKYPMTEYQN